VPRSKTPRLGLLQTVETVMEGYADRPALGQRAVEFGADPRSGRTSLRLLPRFETITYRQLWESAGAVALALSHDRLQPGDRVAVLGFTSADYTTIDLALMRLRAVAVPLQTGVPAAQLQHVVAETQPAVLASSIECLPDAVELVLAGPPPKRLIVFDYHPQDDDQRDAFHTAAAKLIEADSAVVIETLAGVLNRGRVSPPAPVRGAGRTDSADPLALLIYTSGSTGTPKGSSVRSHLLAVVVPTDDAVARAGGDAASMKSVLAESLRSVAGEAGLQSYEVPA